MNRLHLVLTCFALLVASLFSGCYAVKGEGYTFYTPLKTQATALQNEINLEKKRNKAKRKHTCAEPNEDATPVVSRSEEKREARLMVLTKHRDTLTIQAVSLAKKNPANLTEHRASLRRLLTLNTEESRTVREMAAIWQARARDSTRQLKMHKRASVLYASEEDETMIRIEENIRDQGKAALIKARGLTVELNDLASRGAQLTAVLEE